MRYRVFLEQDEDGIYVAEVPALPGCISQGATRAEALANIKEAMEGYIESLEEHGERDTRGTDSTAAISFSGKGSPRTAA